MVPDMRAAMPKVMVSGKRSWLALVNPTARISGWAAGSWKILSGAVRTARNGSTAPMLSISANDAQTISMSKSPNWPRRLGVMWCQRRIRSLDMGKGKYVLMIKRGGGTPPVRVLCGGFCLFAVFALLFHGEQV